MTKLSKNLDSKCLSHHGQLMRSRRSQLLLWSIAGNYQAETLPYALETMGALAPLSRDLSNNISHSHHGQPMLMQARFTPLSSTLDIFQAATQLFLLVTAQPVPTSASLLRTRQMLPKPPTTQPFRLVWPQKRQAKSQTSLDLYLLAADLTSPSDDALKPCTE